MAALVLALALSCAVALPNGPTGRRVVLQRTAAASAAAALFAASPRSAQAARKGMMAPKREAEEQTCYGPNYEKVPCTPASNLADIAPAAPALAGPKADTPDTLDLVSLRRSPKDTPRSPPQLLLQRLLPT
jgi:hypothetical protein